MNDRNLWRGLFISTVAVAFGAAAARYPLGDLAHVGAGLFPLMVSGLLLLVGVTMMARCLFLEKQPIDFKFRNVAIILTSLCGFAFVSQVVNMIAGIAFLVFFSGIAASSYSWKRNIKISVVLVLIAFAFRNFLGLNLPLY
jgi:Tripartite tricarboxylate transporter TctB family